MTVTVSHPSRLVSRLVSLCERFTDWSAEARWERWGNRGDHDSWVSRPGAQSPQAAPEDEPGGASFHVWQPRLGPHLLHTRSQIGPQYVRGLGEPGGHRAGIVAGAQIC